MDPVPCLGFSLQTVTSISGSFLRIRLNLLLFSVQADFDSSSHGGLSHVLRHPPSFSRARVNGSHVSAAACTSEAICLHTGVLCEVPVGCSCFLLAQTFRVAGGKRGDTFWGQQSRAERTSTQVILCKTRKVN